jgi:Domain of unknown function (DUF4394)
MEASFMDLVVAQISSVYSANRRIRSRMRQLAAKFACAFAFVFSSASAFAQTPIIFAYDFSGARLVSFSANAPGILLSDVPLTGFSSGEFLLGIDFRPATGELYGVVFQNATTGRLVKIDKASGAITSVGASTLAIAGSFYGISFNSAVDRIRIVSDFDINIRVNPLTGALTGTDTTLAFAAGDVNTVAPNVVHIAHTNAYDGAFTTTTYGIDVVTDSLVRIGGPNGTPSANAGQLTTIGSLGVAANLGGGFDIEPTSNIGYAVLGIAGASVLHTINLTTGAATAVGTVASSSGNIDGIAIAPPNPCLDLDGDGISSATTDGLMLVRALLGMTGASVTSGAIGTPAPPRSTWAAIRNYLIANCSLHFSP